MTTESKLTGKYHLKRRAERQEKTRRRIVEAAVKLHTSVGPAHTTDAAIAKAAGVTRVTFYRHFPNAAALFKACTAHGLEIWPPPDAGPWLPIGNPVDRLRVGLTELYAYYRTAGPGMAVLVRDGPLMPPGLNPSPNRSDAIRYAAQVLGEGWAVRGRRRGVLRAAIGHAVSVTTWQSLIQIQGLTEAEAVELLIELVVGAAERRHSQKLTTALAAS